MANLANNNAIVENCRALATAVNIANARPVRWDANNNPTAAIPLNQVFISLAHGDRRINLNHPLPVSNDQNEPVRQKWIREAYEVLKQVLPPASIDTPDELAALSQFVVNIIDFRDPDAACTRFVNTDLIVIPPNPSAATPTYTLTLRFRDVTSASDALPTGKSPYEPTIVYDLNNSPPANQHYLIQYRMEYNPVAINEVLAFSFKRKASPTDGMTDTPRLFIELVNTLTKDGNPTQDTSTTPKNLGGGRSSNLNLGQTDVAIPDPSDATKPIATLKALNWDMVIADDDYSSRPDPYTGQVPDMAPVGSRATWPIAYDTAANIQQYQIAMDAGGPPSGNNPVYYYVFSNAAPPSSTPPAEDTAPTVQSASIPTSFFPPTNSSGTPVDPRANPKFYWLYLRRPANSDLPIQNDPTRANCNPAVVVDSFRFPYTESGCDGTTVAGVDAISPSPPPRDLYSVQRL